MVPPPCSWALSPPRCSRVVCVAVVQQSMPEHSSKSRLGMAVQLWCCRGSAPAKSSLRSPCPASAAQPQAGALDLREAPAGPARAP